MSLIAFHRPARLHPETPPAEPVAIPLPPASQAKQGKVVAWLTTLSPLVITGGSMVFFFTIPMHGFIAILLPMVMVLGILSTVMLTIFQKGSEKKSRHQFRGRFLGYLEQQEVLLRERAALQMAAAERSNPDIDELWRMAADRDHVWERRASDADFLHIRIGRGDVPLISAAVMGSQRDPLAEYEADMLEASDVLVRRYTTLREAPFAVDLTTAGSVTVSGEAGRARSLVRAMLCSAAVLHSPEDLSIAVAHVPGTGPDWSWLKWLPHNRDRSPGVTANGSGPPCLITESADGLAGILARTTRQRLDTLQHNERAGEALRQMGHLILLIDGFTPRGDFAQLAALRELVARASAARVTVITIIGHRQDEPSHVDARIEVDHDGMLGFVEAKQAGARASGIVADHCDVATAETIARCLAPLRLEERKEGGGGELAATVRLLDLLGVSSPDRVDPRQSWRTRHPRDVLRVPIGARADGEPMLIDLKEAAVGGMGPHGLVIGATGSGKSELLRTLVTALAITHAPDVLSFVFVDFKGGAAFADLSELPHVAGMITNLQGDLSRVDRMYSALVGEQDRRQRLLRDAGNLDGIKEYHRQRAARPELPPMPYLIIVIDEFGELLAERPDFLDLFLAIGRVGRSLGMHLLFATQRLEEGRLKGLEGHLRYRFCLRTFSPQESKAVIGTDDAYHLPPFPGAGYFKVDTTTYTRFKTALITSPFGEVRSGAKRASVVVFAGAAVQTKPASDEETSSESAASVATATLPTEMEVAIGRLNELGAGLTAPVHQVWLPPLEEDLALTHVFADAGIDTKRREPIGPLRILAGMLDLPMQQAQEPFALDFATTGGHLMLAGAPQTGKSVFLRTLISSFALTHSPEDVQFYCLDFGGGGLHSLKDLPHVGAVADRFERDLMRRVVRQMHSVIEEREILFRKHAIDSMATFRRKRRAGELPASMLGDVFLVIDNWAGFKQEFEEADAEIAPLLSTGLGYGVHVIITSPRWADIRAALKDNIGARYELRLNDPTDSEMPRGAAKTLPVNIPGRGLTPQSLQFQIALPRIGEASAGDIGADVAHLVDVAEDRWRDAAPAPPVRLLPPQVRLTDLPEPAPDGPPGVPMGLEEFRLEPVYFDLFGSEPHFLMLGDGECGKTTLIRAWMHQLRHRYTADQVRFVVVDYRRTLLDSASGDYVESYAATAPIATEAISTLRQRLVDRLPAADITRDELINRSWWSGPEYVLFVDDYDLVVTPAGNPLQPLVELLPQGRDVGFHLVIARRVGGVARSAFEAVLQRVKELGSPALIMSGDPGEGPVVGPQKAQLQPPGRGFLVRRGQRTALVQTVRVDASE